VRAAEGTYDGSARAMMAGAFDDYIAPALAQVVARTVRRVGERGCVR
jgi:hypothetical protein